MTLSLQELKKRIKGTQGRFDLLNLKDDLEGFIRGPQFMELAENERDQALDLLADVLTKVDGCKGCDPLRTILGR
ncbi:MAG: hypothetical protein A2Z08_01480 [Deltaproteobacteria bacterium RBG_16_54_11]|nr:MAG: hypothetical protein A2Z08_01480 [Deltaproteobacteria bacterium RBG_16_54_11]